MEFKINITYEPLKHARQYGIVYKVPEWLPEGLDFDVKVGDKVYFHHLITANTGNLNISKKFGEASWKDYESEHLFTLEEKENLYKVHWDHIYARVRKGKIKMLNHWNFIEQRRESEDDIKTKSGIYFKPDVEDVTLRGYVRNMNPWLKAQGIKEGDEVLFSTNSEYEMKIEGEKLLRMRNVDILAKVENG
jgi:co-chaperonin GroES (HSP10)